MAPAGPRTAPTTVAAPPKKEASEGMVAAGYILAFLFPIVGVVIGVMLMGRDNRHGRWILGLSLLFMRRLPADRQPRQLEEN